MSLALTFLVGELLSMNMGQRSSRLGISAEARRKPFTSETKACARRGAGRHENGLGSLELSLCRTGKKGLT